MFRSLAFVFGVVAVVGCDDGGDSQTDAGAPAPTDAPAPAPTDAAAPAPFAELEAQGAMRFLGQSEGRLEVSEGGVDTYIFDAEGGPVCMRGTPFRVAVRDQGSTNLIVYLKGGGACWDGFCLTIAGTTPGIPTFELLDVERPGNPVGDWNQVFISYCDGSLFAGHTEVDEDGDGRAERIHRGLQNLSAGLDVAKRRFPDAKRILLAGSSAGAYGTIPATPLVRAQFPGIPIDVFNDSGAGIAKGDRPEFLADLLSQWNAHDLVPASCTDCLENGHLTRLIGWALDRDPNLRVAVFSSLEDSVLSTLFLRISPASFRAAITRETDALAARHPERFQRFLVPGKQHTSLLGTVEGVIGDLPEGTDLSSIVELGGMDQTAVGEVTVADWLAALVSDDPAWTSHVDEGPR